MEATTSSSESGDGQEKEQGKAKTTDVKFTLQKELYHSCTLLLLY